MLTRPILALTVSLLVSLGAKGTQAEESPPPPAGGPVRPVTPDLQQRFLTPADADKPWAYWWWIKGNVSEESIRRDLDQMKRKGFGGFLLFDARGYHEGHVPPPPSRMEFMGPEWRRMFRLAISEAGRLGLKASVNLSSCAGALKGPWDVGDDAPKKLVWASQEIQGPRPFRGALPRGDWGRAWNIAVVAARHEERAEAKPAEAKTTIREVVDLTGRLDGQGDLAWDVPAGRWTLLRFAYVTMAGHENDVDVLDPRAVEGHFRRMGQALLDDAGPLAGKTLTHFYSVSWEGAAPTWTPGFERHFAQRRGYAIQSYLPVLAGLTVRDREASERFLRDYHKTLGDLFMDQCYGKLRELSRRAGLQWHSESGGPWDRKLPGFRHADQLAFLGRNDMPQGEFWHPSRGFNRPAAVAAHIYGRPLAAAEAFTHMQAHWSVYPALLKPLADAAFSDGINQLIWHTFTASPPEFGKPGIEYFAGSHLNPNVTWWEQSGPMLAYLARCQAMLRQGHYVADVCCYTGDNPYLHWGRGERWSDKPSLVLDKGYAYDLLNTEVLLERLSVEGDALLLPDGMRYRVLVVDLQDETTPPQALQKIRELAEAGATVVLGKRRPERAPGLTGYPGCDEQVRRLGDSLWGPPVASPSCRTLGKGHVLSGHDLPSALAARAITPDCTGPWDWIHRRAGDLDLYFLAGSGRGECVFRVRGKQPELWDPATGRILENVPYRVASDGRTLVSLDLPENGSVFVVFRKPATAIHLASISGADGALEIVGGGEGKARLRAWGGGRGAVETSQGRRIEIESTRALEPKPLAGPWDVRFTPGRGAPASARFERLIPWIEHAEEGIRFFSGTGTYRRSFELDEVQARSCVRLQLGQVRHVAEVRVNGKHLGVVWTAPWSVDLTGAVRPGANELEIDVTNVWANRLIGDARLPPEKRFTKTNVRLVPERLKLPRYQAYAADDPLQPSGLLGPVRLEFGEEREVSF